jgi:hypothetical protein
MYGENIIKAPIYIHFPCNRALRVCAVYHEQFNIAYQVIQQQTPPKYAGKIISEFVHILLVIVWFPGLQV